MLRENGRARVPEKLLLRRWGLLAGVGIWRTAVTVLHPLLALGLHLVPLLLLPRIQNRADLVVGALVDLHHLGVPILLGDRGILAQAFHLGTRGLENVLHFGLLIGSQLELSGQFPRAPRRIGRTVAVHT